MTPKPLLCVPLGVQLPSGLAFLFYRERKQRLQAQKLTNDVYAAMKKREARATYQGYEMSDYARRQALDYNQKRLGELDTRSGNVYGADGQP